MANTGLVITNDGLAVASTAAPGGPYIHITEFRVGDGFNYTPVETDTDLHGNLLYTGGVTNYYVVDYDTIELILFMDASIGPFSFGEVGIYLDDGTLFALCAWDSLQEKLRAIGNQAGTQWRIRARLTLAAASVVCQVDVITSTQIIEVSTWPFLVTPENQVGNANMVIMTGEFNSFGDTVMVFKDAVDEWTINDFVEVFRGNSSDSGCTIGVSSIVHPNLPQAYFTVPRTDSRYLIKFPDGDIRRVTDLLSTTEITWDTAKAVPLTGEFSVWEEAGSACCRAPWADRFEYNRWAALFNPLWEAPTGTYPGDNEGLGQTPIADIAAPAHPTLVDWNLLHDYLVAKCKIHGVDTSDIVYCDYAYCKNNPNGWGIMKNSEQFQIITDKIAELTTERNTADPLYQESSVPAGGQAARTLLWSGTKTHTISLTYTSLAAFQALVNGGHQINVTADVVTGANANWLDLKNFFLAFGTITIQRGDTIKSGGSGTATSIGLYDLTGSYQTLFSHAATITGGPASYTLQGRITGSVVELKVEIANTGTGYYASGVLDLLTSRVALRRPEAATLMYPVLAYPAATSVSDF